MYKVTCEYDGATYILHDPLSEKLWIYDDEISTEKNAPGSFYFSVSYDHPYLDKIVGLSSYICVYDDDELIFAGRPTDDGEDIYRARTFQCEGELAFLYDSIQPRRELHDISPLEFFTLLIEEHNSQVTGYGPIDKTFQIGVVTVTDSNNSLYRYTNRETTLDDLQDKLIDSLGGYLRIRHEDGVRYIDYLADTETVGDQPIQLGENLLTFAKDTDYTEVATACIPLGAMLDESEISALQAYVTCADANDGNEVVVLDEAVERYGFICKIIQYDTATTAEYLLSAAQEWLKSGQYADMTLEMTAVDLHTLGYDLQPIRVNTQVRIVSKPHGMDMWADVSERTYHLTKPEADTVTIGSTAKEKSYTNTSADNIQYVESALDGASKNIASVIEKAKENASNILNQATHGYVVLDPNDGPERILIMDTNSVDSAQKIWKWDMNGLGYSSTGINGPWGLAITMDGQIVANYIATGELDASLIKVGTIMDATGTNWWDMESGELTLSSYATYEYLGDNYYTAGETDSAIQAEAGSILLEVSGNYATTGDLTEAIETAEGYTDNKLTSYSTTSQMNSAINTAVSNESASILQTVSGTYATQGSVTEAIETAEGYTDSKLTNYTTTTDMNAAISTAVSSESASILQTVSGTYATTGSVTEAIATAEGYTDTKLTNYTTTTDMNAAIETAVSEESASITSEISKNYVQISTTTDADGNVLADYTTTTEIYNAITQMITESENSLKLYVSETVGEGESVSSMLVLEIATDSNGNKYGRLSANVDYLELDTGDFVLNSSQFSVDINGNATYSGTLNAASGSFSGDIYATSGYFSGTLAADIVTASNIQDAAVTNAAIAAAAVTNSSIASGAVTYDKISVSELSAISADVGTLTAGIIKSSNYVSGSAGVYIDLTNGTAEFSGDVRATSFSLGSAVFSIKTTYITEKTIDANGNMASSIGPYDYLELSTSGDEGLVADAITVTYLGATTAYADGLHSKYVYTQYTINTEDITVRNDVETWYLYCRTGYFTIGLSAADTTVNGTLDVSGSTTISASLTVSGTNTLSVGGDANMYSNAAVWGNLTVVGWVEASAYNDSDRRLKTELESLSIYDTFFDSLQTGRFKYNFDESGKYHMGMYAQDVEESLSACGLTANDFAGLMTTQKSETSATYHGIDEEYLLNYTEFVPILIYQVQQEKKKTAALKAIVEGLQEQIEAIYEVIQASA